MRLSEHLTLEECVKSTQAEELGIDNTPSPQIVDALKALTVNCFEPLRVAFGYPIKIVSGYRCTVLNQKVGGASLSQHCRGEALDMKSDDNAYLFYTAKSQNNFDQLIWENGSSGNPAWVHISFSVRQKRGEVLRKFASENHYHKWDEAQRRWACC